MIKRAVKSGIKSMKPGYGQKSPMKSGKVDSGFYGAGDLKPKFLKKIDSTGGYEHARNESAL